MTAIPNIIMSIADKIMISILLPSSTITSVEIRLNFTAVISIGMINGNPKIEVIVLDCLVCTAIADTKVNCIDKPKPVSNKAIINKSYSMIGFCKNSPMKKYKNPELSIRKKKLNKTLARYSTTGLVKL